VTCFSPASDNFENEVSDMSLVTGTARTGEAAAVAAYTGEKARLARAYDYLILVLVLFLFMGIFHLHMMLTVGDWDFWLDCKDRQWWPLLTPVMLITFPAAAQAVLWTSFRLPMGATLCISCLLIGAWIARYFSYHLWNYFPINEVLPATMLPSALVLELMMTPLSPRKG
jgi:methane/ammonia monooxygenase subunit A